MNYYELSNTVTPDTIGYKNGLWQKRYVQIYRVLTVVWSVLTLCLLFGMFHRDDYSSGMIKSCLLLFLAGIIFLVLMLIAVVNISAKRTENWTFRTGMITIWLCTEPDTGIIGSFSQLC